MSRVKKASQSGELLSEAREEKGDQMIQMSYGWIGGYLKVSGQ